MKIITGTAKGMNLETLAGEKTRPTSQRVKEAIFSMLQFDIEGAMVLDLFAGSGQMGLEALSRGAKKSIFFDIARDACDVVINNAKKAKLFSKCVVSTCDYKQALRGLAKKEKFDIVFIDPPYQDGIIVDVLTNICKGDILNENAFVVCESGKADIFEGNDVLASYFVVQKQSKYSISYVTVLRPNGENI